MRGCNKGSSLQESPVDLLGGKNNLIWQRCPIASRMDTCKGEAKEKRQSLALPQHSVQAENLGAE